jgi:hypothetical protein
MDNSIKFLTTMYISFSVAQHDVTHHPAYQPELLSSRAVSILSLGTRYKWAVTFRPRPIYHRGKKLGTHWIGETIRNDIGPRQKLILTGIFCKVTETVSDRKSLRGCVTAHSKGDVALMSAKLSAKGCSEWPFRTFVRQAFIQHSGASWFTQELTRTGHHLKSEIASCKIITALPRCQIELNGNITEQLKIPRRDYTT